MRGLTRLLATILGASLPAQALAENGDAAAPSRPAPVIQCDEPVASFGEQAQDEIVQHVFAIWNRGDAPLEITGVKACCGATAVLADQVVAPGQSTSVALVASLRGRSGQVRRTVRIASNDPKQPEYLLQLVGSVPAKAQAQPAPPASAPHGGPPPVASVQKNYRARPHSPAPPITSNTPASPGHISVVPAELHLVPGVDASPLTQTLLIRSVNNTSFQVTRVDSPSADWTVDLRPVAPGLWRVRIQHIVNGAAFDGKSIRIHTDVPDFPVLAIPIRWNDGAISDSLESEKQKMADRK